MSFYWNKWILFMRNQCTTHGSLMISQLASKEVTYCIVKCTHAVPRTHIVKSKWWKKFIIQYVSLFKCKLLKKLRNFYFLFSRSVLYFCKKQNYPSIQYKKDYLCVESTVFKNVMTTLLIDSACLYTVHESIMQKSL